MRFDAFRAREELFLGIGSFSADLTDYNLQEASEAPM